MEYLELIVGFLGGVIGALAVAAFLARRLVDHRLNKSLEVYKFVLTNRANACSEILLSVGRVITASRDLTAKPKRSTETYDKLAQSIVELEDCLRPACFLLDGAVYKQIHDFKTVAQSLHRAGFAPACDSERTEETCDIENLVDELETKREHIAKDIRKMMDDLR